MFDRVLNTPLKSFRSFVEKTVKVENPLSTLAVKWVISGEKMNSFMKLLFRSKQINSKNLLFIFWGRLSGRISHEITVSSNLRGFLFSSKIE